MDNRKKLVIQSTQHTSQIHVREYRRDNRKKLVIQSTQHTSQINVRVPKGQSKIDNRKKLVIQSTQHTSQINVREYRRDNQKWTIVRNW